MLNMVRPKYFMPIHGEYRHLRYHGMLAEKTVVPKENIFILEDGEVARVEVGAYSVAIDVGLHGEDTVLGDAASPVDEAPEVVEWCFDT